MCIRHYGGAKLTGETMHKILNLYDRAKEDPEYLALHDEYTPAQGALVGLLERLPSQERKIVEDYLHTSVALFHRLLEMGLAEQK